MVKDFVRGIYYRNSYVYYLLTRLSHIGIYKLRYNIVLQYINSGDTVLDVCGAGGEIMKYLPSNCDYACIEFGDGFIGNLKRKGIRCKKIDLHKDKISVAVKSNIAVMIVSLYQFRDSSAEDILESLKMAADKVVIVEDILGNMWRDGSLIQKIINYLHETDYHRQSRMFSLEEFRNMMQKHGYEFRQYDKRYAIGCYGLL